MDEIINVAYDEDGELLYASSSGSDPIIHAMIEEGFEIISSSQCRYGVGTDVQVMRDGYEQVIIIRPMENLK